MTTRDQAFAAGLAWVIVVERANLDHPDEPGIVECYGPFSEAEVRVEQDSDVSPLLFDPVHDRINCTEWQAYPLVFPNWLDEK